MYKKQPQFRTMGNIVYRFSWKYMYILSGVVSSLVRGRLWYETILSRVQAYLPIVLRGRVTIFD